MGKRKWTQGKALDGIMLYSFSSSGDRIVSKNDRYKPIKPSYEEASFKLAEVLRQQQSVANDEDMPWREKQEALRRLNSLYNKWAFVVWENMPKEGEDHE
jgi:hypothetical protein